MANCKRTLISKNPIKHLGSVIEFINRHANLEAYQLEISIKRYEVGDLAFNEYDVLMHEVKLRKRSIFGGVAFMVQWNKHFCEHIELPYVVLNDAEQTKLEELDESTLF